MMRLGRKKDKDKEEKDKDKEKKEKKDKKEKKEKRKSLSTKKPSSSSSKKRTIKAKIEIHPQAISNLPIDLNNSILFLSWKRGAKKSNRGESKRVQVSNGRCVWGDDQPAIPIQATFVQYKGKFTDKKLQLTLHSQVDKKVGHKVSEWELHLCEYAADGTDKSINLANTGKSSNPSIFTARLLTTWLKIDNKTIVTKTGDDYDLASETDGSDTEGDTSIESDMESDMSDMSDDDDDDDDEVDMDDDGKIKFVDKGKGGSKIEMKRGSKIIPAADPKKDEHDKHEKEEKEKKEKEREEKEKKEREEKEKKEKKEERERKEQEEKERLAKEKEKEKEELEKKEKEEKEKKAAAAAATAAAPGLKDSRTMPTAGQETYGLCKSLYSWKGEKEGDLSFAAGEIIQITSKNERWWEGTAKSGQKGTFPKNYVAEISESDEAKASSAASSFTAVPTRPPPGPAPVAGPAGLPPPPAFSRPGFAPRTPPVATPLTPPASLVTPATPTPAPSTPTPAPTTPSPPVSGVVSPPYSPPGRVAPPVPSQADKEKREREERERKEKEDKEKREREEQEKARKLKEEQEKRDKEEREKKEKEEKERKEREEKEKKEREEREGTRKGRLEGARAMFERGSAAPAPAPAVDHAKAAEERKAKIFQTGSLGARIESLGSKKSDTQPTPAAQPAAATTAALGSRTSHGAEEPKGTNASGQPPAKANGAVVDSAAAAEQERKLHELQRKLDEASADNKKLKSEKEERVRELEGKTKELERMLADKNQEIWNLREDKTAAAASKDMGEQLAKLRAEAEAERKGWQKKVEDMERDAAKLREEKDRAVAQLKEEKDRELVRMREEKDRAAAQLKEEKDREIARLREEKAAAEKRLVGDGEPSTGKTQELQRMLADKNQEIWDLREALEKREKESAQAAAKSDRDWKDRSERDAREAKAAGDRAQELSKRSGEQADELARLRSALESKDRELSELREKSRAPSPTASPRMPAINPAEFELQRKQLEALRQQVSKAREDNNALSQKLSDKDREIREEKRVSESLREDIQRAERDKADLRAAADRERAERERRERDLRSREGSENSEMAGLRTEINRVLEEKRGLTITLDGQRGEINKLQDELRARQKKIDDLKEEVNDLKEEIRDKDEEMDKLKGELDERLREAERLKGHVEEHSDKVEKLREELTIKTGELIERERADKTEVGKENLLQQKTTKLEKMVRDMHVELNVKKQSLKKAIKQSEQKEMEIRRLKDKVENLKRQLDEMESGKKDSESDSESESEDEDSGTRKKKKSKKSKDDDDDDDDDDDKDDGKNLKKTLKKLEIKKDVLKQRLEKLDMVEKTILAVEVRRKDEGRGGADRDDSDDEREPGDGGDAIEVAQDLFWFLEKNGLFDKDHTDQHLLNHVIDALDATLERCVGNTEHQAYYLSLVSTLIQSIILDKEKMEPFRVDEDLVEACAAMREDGIGVIDERRARELEQKQKCAAMKANNSAEVDIDRRPAAMGSGGGGEGGGRGRGGPPPDMSGGGRGRGGYPPDGRGRGGGPAYDSPNRGRGGPPSRGGRGDFAGGPPPGAGPGRGRGGGPDYGPMGDSGGRGRGGAPGWDEPRRPSEGGGGRGRGGPPAFSPNASDDEEDGGARTRDEPPVAPAPKKPKRAELRRSATGESLLSSFLRRLYFVAERIFLEMHARVVDAVAPLLIPAILSHPNPGSSIGPPKPGGPRVQHLPSPAEMSGGGSDRLPPTEQDVTRHLDVVFTQLSSHSVFPAIMQQFASVVYYSLNVVLLNVVLKRPELCTCSNGFKMKWGLARLTSWLYKSDSDPFVFPRPAEIEDQLQHITEAATLLVMDKAVFAKPQAVRRQFVELSGPQLRALLFNFRPDAMAPEKVAEEWKKTAAMMASHEGGPLLLADPLLGPMRG